VVEEIIVNNKHDFPELSKTPNHFEQTYLRQQKIQITENMLIDYYPLYRCSLNINANC